MNDFHETYREHDAAKASSARTFGVLIGALLLLASLRSFVRGGRPWPELLATGIALLLAAVARPAALDPLNRAWMALARLLNRVVSPVVLALLFVVVIWPAGLAMRLAGGDPLRLRRAPRGESWWIEREPLANDHFTRQF